MEEEINSNEEIKEIVKIFIEKNYEELKNINLIMK